MSATGTCRQCGLLDMKVLLDGGRLVRVDACIARIVQSLNDGGVCTRASCCGHGRGPGSILLADGREITVHPEYVSVHREGSEA